MVLVRMAGVAISSSQEQKHCRRFISWAGRPKLGHATFSAVRNLVESLLGTDHNGTHSIVVPDRANDEIVIVTLGKFACAN